MRHLLLLLLLATATALPAAPYRNERCGVEFELPRGWVVGEWGDHWWKHDLRKQDVRCDLGIGPAGSAGKAEVEILVVDQPFRKVARMGGFRQVRDFPNGNADISGRLGTLEPDDWTIAVRMGQERAEAFRTACCQGVRGSTWDHFRHGGAEAGDFTSDVVVLNDRKRHSVYIATQVSERFTNELNRIVDTFRFIR